VQTEIQELQRILSEKQRAAAECAAQVERIDRDIAVVSKRYATDLSVIEEEKQQLQAEKKVLDEKKVVTDVLLSPCCPHWSSCSS